MTTRVKFTAVTNAGSGVVLRGQGTSPRGVGGGGHAYERVGDGYHSTTTRDESNLGGAQAYKDSPEEEKRRE